MRSTSPSRRALGLLAVSTIGMSTAVLGVSGIAAAAPTPTFSFDGSSSTVVVPAGICAVDWTLTGARGGASSTPLPGGPGGRLVVRTEVYTGDEFELVVGGVGGNATSTAGGTGGASSDDDFEGQPGSTYYDTDDETPIGGSGGGGAATAVLAGGSPYLVAFGGVGGGPDGGQGSYGTENFPGFDNPTPSTDGQAPVNAPAGISGVGVPCVADQPYLNYVDAGDGQLTVDFVAPEDNDIAITGYEVTLDGGTTFSSLATSVDEGRTVGTVTGLVNEQTYDVGVRAVGGTGNALKGAWSRFESATPYLPLPAPVITALTTGPSQVTLSWTAPAGVVKGYDVGVSTGANGGQGCATAPSVLTCTFVLPAGSGYTIGVRAIDMQDRPGSYASRDAVTVPGPAVPSAVPTKDDGDLVGPAGPISSLTAGQTITLQGTGYAPNSTVQLVVYSSPVTLGTVVTDQNGSFSVEVTVPANLANGTHHLVATGIDANGNVRNLVIAVTVSGGVATLATTGFDVVPVAVGGALVLLVGGGLAVGARRRTA